MVYVDPFAAGHHHEHLAFYLKVCARLGITLRAHVPAKNWDRAAALAEGAAADAVLARDIDVGERNLRRQLDVVDQAAADARSHGAQLIYYPMLDNFLLTLAVRRATGRRHPVKWSGVYVFDTFNFPQDEAAFPLRRGRSLVKLFLLRLAAWGDSAGILAFNANWRAPMPVPVSWLPDALSSLDRIAEREGAQAWPLPQPDHDDGRLRLLMFGALSPRKGVWELTQGLLKLTDAELARIELKVLGRFAAKPAEHRARCEAAFAELTRRGAHLTLVAEHVPESMLDEALRWTDVVLTPYIRHLGSSGLITQATLYGRPMLTQDLYQMGDEARRWGLGTAVDPADPDALAEAVRRMLADRPAVSEGMRALREVRNPTRAFEAALAAVRAMIEAA